MKHRPGSSKITVDEFTKLFYVDRLPNSAIAAFFNCTVSAIGSFRHRYGLPPRGWAKGHPMLGRKRSAESIEKTRIGSEGKRSKEKNWNWKGGVHHTNYGYIAKRIENHPFARRYILEHRLVMEKHIGRFLEKSEIVHHINGNKLDNRIENLEILTRAEHARLHSPRGSKFGIHMQSGK